MSLRHEFNQTSDGRGGDPKLILRIDAALTRWADRWADRWQARRGQSRRGLTFDLYVIATVAAGGYVTLTGEWLFLGIGVLAYASGARGKQQGGLIDEMQLEAAGMPRHLLKYLGVFLLGLGLFGASSGFLLVLLDALIFGTVMMGLPSLIGGVAITALKVADYVARTNPRHHGGDPEVPMAWARPPRAMPVAGYRS